jgi:thymidine kinase
MQNECGYLELILGPMYSGKTTTLIELFNRYRNENKNVVVINYAEDKRYSSSMLSTHNHIQIPCIFAHKINDVLNLSKEADILLINEGQFFEDIYDTVFYLVEKLNKTVYICGLDGDFKRNLFGNIYKLIPLCDEVKKLSAICKICKKAALFSHRVIHENKRDDSQILIGSDNYIPLCRQCYQEMENS